MYACMYVYKYVIFYICIILCTCFCMHILCMYDFVAIITWSQPDFHKGPSYMFTWVHFLVDEYTVRSVGCCDFRLFADRHTYCPCDWFLPVDAFLRDRPVTENITQFPSKNYLKV